MTTSDTPETDKEADKGDGLIGAEFAKKLERERNALREQLAKKDAALAVCVEALTKIKHGDCRTTRKIEKCAHGQYGYENCEACFNDFADDILAKLPESAKQAAKVLEAAREVAGFIEEDDYGWKCDSTPVLQKCVALAEAVRGMKG